MSSTFKSELPPPEEILSKQQWREQIQSRLSKLDEEEIAQQSRDAVATLLAMPEYQQARRLSVFMSMPKGELQTAAIVHDAFDKGKEVFIPYIYKVQNPTGSGKVSVMDMLHLSSLEDYAALEPDRWGIPSIAKDSVGTRLNCFGTKGLTNGESVVSCGQALDLILMPAMAFDQEMNRLGHGAGYYDKFVKRVMNFSSSQGVSSARPYLIGLALTQQVLPEPYRLPIESWDHRVDAVVSGSKVTRAMTGRDS